MIHLNCNDRCHVGTTEYTDADIRCPMQYMNITYATTNTKLTTGGSSVGKGVIGAGVVGRTMPGVGANVLFVPADTIAIEAELIRIDVILSFIFDRLLYCYC